MTATIDEREQLTGGAISAELLTLGRALDAYLDSVAGGAASRATTAELIAETHALESFRRRLSSADHALIAEFDQRGTAGVTGTRSTSGLLKAMLRITPAEASRRVAASRALAPTTTLTGAVLPPLLPELAAATAAGAISADHTNLILQALDQLPGTMSTNDFADAERILTDLARHRPPRDVAIAARRLLNTLDPDGAEPRDDRQQRLRSMTLSPTPTGMWTLRGDLTPECGELLNAFLGSRSAPRPSDASGPDTRSYGQRLHDALAEGAHVLARHDDTGLPASGAPSTVLVTLTGSAGSTVDAATSCTSGEHLSDSTVGRLVDEAVLIALTRDSDGTILRLGRSRRLASRSQTYALVARDRGCSFPGCDAPPHWCQRHHITPWHAGGRTDLENLTLLCHYHHREHESRGWTCTMTNSLPHWTAPAWVDPEQIPRVNLRITAPP